MMFYLKHEKFIPKESMIIQFYYKMKNLNKEKSTKIYKLNISGTMTNSRSKLTEVQKRGILNKFLNSHTPQQKKFPTITDPSSDLEDDFHTRMPKLTQVK